MYCFKTNVKKQYLQGRTIKYVADLVGITSAFLTSVLNGKRNCSKLTAYCITKALNKDAEIQDCFIRKEE